MTNRDSQIKTEEENILYQKDEVYYRLRQSNPILWRFPKQMKNEEHFQLNKQLYKYENVFRPKSKRKRERK
jgi:hypothetical protein